MKLLDGDIQGIISTIILISLFLMMFTNIGQKLQLMFLTANLKSKLAILEKLLNDALSRSEKLLALAGSKNPKKTVRKLTEFFVIEPVSIEPTDIIRRLAHILDTRRHNVRRILVEDLGEKSKHELSNIEVVLEVTSALNYLYKVVRHYLLLGEKTSNLILVMQLAYLMPTILKIADAYHKSLDAFEKGLPIGDGLGPLVAYRLTYNVPRKPIVEETVYSITEIDGRLVYVVKAEGPGATVGKPGEAIEKLVEKEKGNISRIITVDAALKLEGEETGSIAEGVGAAIGDPGPEKIRIERIATKYNIPVDALVVKMSAEEAIQTMNKKIAEAADKVVEEIKDIIKHRVPKGGKVIVAGIGNTIGII